MQMLRYPCFDIVYIKLKAYYDNAKPQIVELNRVHEGEREFSTEDSRNNILWCVNADVNENNFQEINSKNADIEQKNEELRI